MVVLKGDNTANIISATGPNDKVLGRKGDDTLMSSFERADLRGGDGKDHLNVNYLFDSATASAYPDLKWVLFGGKDADFISVNVEVTDDYIEFPLEGEPVLDIDANGGSGNDTIKVYAYNSIFNFASDAYPREPIPVINTAIVDRNGDNSLEIDTLNFGYDSEARTNTKIRLGSGDDNVDIFGASDSYNNVTVNIYDVDLGNGDNTIVLDEVHGTMTFDLRSGSGSDIADLNFASNEGNSHFVQTDLFIDLGDGDDLLTLFMSSGLSGYTFVEAEIELGGGHNTAIIDGVRQSQFDISAGRGDDIIELSLLAPADLLFGGELKQQLIDAGAGDNEIVVEQISGFDPYYGASSAVVITDSGNDRINLVGGVNNVVDSGGGNDAVGAGSGTDDVTLGSGADTLSIDRSIFSTSTDSLQELVIRDFNLSEHDAVRFSGWDIPALAPSGALSDISDLLGLQSPGGDVINFVQAGEDAVLSLRLGDGKVGYIRFMDFDISNLMPGSSNPHVRGDEKHQHQKHCLNTKHAEGNAGDHNVNKGVDHVGDHDTLVFKELDVSSGKDWSDPEDALIVERGASNGELMVDSFAFLGDQETSGGSSAMDPVSAELRDSSEKHQVSDLLIFDHWDALI